MSGLRLLLWAMAAMTYGAQHALIVGAAPEGDASLAQGPLAGAPPERA